MKRKNFFKCICAFIILLGAFALLINESYASCEIKNRKGEVIFSCSGNSGSCSAGLSNGNCRVSSAVTVGKSNNQLSFKRYR